MRAVEKAGVTNQVLVQKKVVIGNNHNNITDLLIQGVVEDITEIGILVEGLLASIILLVLVDQQ
jgi:hypothetical protein